MLYFLLRYPGTVAGGPDRLDSERLGVLIAWHEAEPPGDYDRHRNAAISELQGNRNPLIDHPEWATQIDFAAALS